MGKKFFLVSAIVAIIFSACSPSKADKQADEDSENRADSIAAVEAARKAAEQARLDAILQDSLEQEQKKQEDDKQVEIFLRDYYNKYLLKSMEATPLKSHFSKNLLKRLAKEYREENGESGAAQSYAFYKMRGDSEDPMGKMTDFAPLNDDWYQIKFFEDTYDGKNGAYYSIKIKAIVENGNVILTDYQAPVYQGNKPLPKSFHSIAN